MLTQNDIKVIKEIVELPVTENEFFSRVDEIIKEIKAIQEAIKFHMYGRIT